MHVSSTRALKYPYTQTFTQATEAEKHHDACEDEEREDEEAGEASDPGASIILTPALRFLRFWMYLQDLNVPELCSEIMDKVKFYHPKGAGGSVSIVRKEAILAYQRFNKDVIGWTEHVVLTKLLKVSDVCICVCVYVFKAAGER